MEGFDLATIQGCYAGSTPATALYIGSKLIWPTGPHDYSKDYLTFEVVTPGSLYFITSGSGLSIEYSKNNGATWTTATATASPGTEIISSSDPVGQKVLLRGNNLTYGTTENKNYFRSTPTNPGAFKLYGNIMSLVYYGSSIDFRKACALSSSDTFYDMFAANISSYLTDISNLILPATTLTDNCYGYMFSGQNMITTTPFLPAQYPFSGSYYRMFYGCTRLNYVNAAFLDEPTDEISGFSWDWLYDVAATGTFVKNHYATWTDRGTYAVPTGWTIVDAKIETHPYLCGFERGINIGTTEVIWVVEDVTDLTTINYDMADTTISIQLYIDYNTYETAGVTVTSTDPNVFAVDDGMFGIVGPGTATVTIDIPETNYNTAFYKQIQLVVTDSSQE